MSIEQYRNMPSADYPWFAEDLDACDRRWYRTEPEALAYAQALIDLARTADGWDIDVTHDACPIIVGHLGLIHMHSMLDFS